MTITIHRGINQIGGCITEIASASGKKILIDLGHNLRRYNGNYIYQLEGNFIREYNGQYLYEIEGFVSRRELLGLLAILFV